MAAIYKVIHGESPKDKSMGSSFDSTSSVSSSSSSSSFGSSGGGFGGISAIGMATGMLADVAFGSAYKANDMSNMFSKSSTTSNPFETKDERYKRLKPVNIEVSGSTNNACDPYKKLKPT